MADPLRAMLRVARAHLTDDGLRALGMRRTARGETMVAPVSALRRAAQRAGVPWPYTARGRPDLRRARES